MENNKIIGSEALEAIPKSKQIITPSGYYSEEEVAGFLGKGINTLQTDHSRRSPCVPSNDIRVKAGKRILYKKSEFDLWLSNQTFGNWLRRTKGEGKNKFAT